MSNYVRGILDILDRIMAEIEEEYGGCYICEWDENYDWDENDISDYLAVGDIKDILEIIDKYRNFCYNKGKIRKKKERKRSDRL